MTEFDEALALIKGVEDDTDFAPQPPERVARAERALGVQFPPTYRLFLIELGAGGVEAEEIYGVINDDFDDARPPQAVGLTRNFRRQGVIGDDLVVIYALGQGSYYGLATGRSGPDGEAPVVSFDPGLSTAADDLEVVSPDFGTFFLEIVRSDLP